ncbi:sensor histidine kinase [Altericroceibacterium endophyticum]|uniref:histidine kinase n=1 Tax=Altericroceibacterium endophyticum TaxID=1808508 RepID=A0A6I4T523_9SPHN|nr:HAMP domain-containing sensor histidine kinase [Altericroceibacterium endophyticum]MXO64795.1 GHKL domain-containing protein [Altericroceibacterium endophyticum]
MMLYHRRGWRAAALGVALLASALVAAFAWDSGRWALLTGATLVGLWALTLAWWNAALVPSRPPERRSDADDEDAAVHRLLLDAAPTPLLAIDRDTARALNRAARTIFACDDRILPVPAALLDPSAPTLRHEGRRWRIDRVEASSGMTVAALIDVEREELAAEARASADLIEVLGHELLNGLSPIVSLAESAQTAAAMEPVDTALLAEILGPLARRADGLQRFATDYRALARLPEPILTPVSLDQFGRDLAQLFARRWPTVALTTEIGNVGEWRMDRDQIHQAVWALLNNAAEASIATEQPRVTLSMTYVENRLVIAIADNGAGVQPENAAFIFRPFHTTKPEGSGIGLSLARQIVRGHGGSLELAGATPTLFQINLPRAVGG